MTDRLKGRKDVPAVEVVRRPVNSSSRPAVSPVPLAPKPISPRPLGAVVPPRPTGSIAPRPIGTRPAVNAPAPVAEPARAGSPTNRFAPRGPPRPPPTAEQIDLLARKEHVPARIAKGELEGKMKVRIWRKLHKEEAARFDLAYALMEKHPSVPLAEAFGCVQSGLPLEEFLQRRARVKKKEEVKVARTAVNGEEIDSFIGTFITKQEQLAFVLAERTLLDAILETQPVSFKLEKSGRLEKLQVVTLTKKAVWEKWLSQLEREPKLAQKPMQVARQPARRPVSDPRPFVDHLTKPVKLTLRNGLTLSFPLRAVGPFDLLCGPSDDEVFFVPLHSIVEWAPV